MRRKIRAHKARAVRNARLVYGPRLIRGPRPVPRIQKDARAFDTPSGQNEGSGRKAMDPGIGPI